MNFVRNAFFLFAFVFVTACCGAEVNGRQVAYVGGTASSVAVDAIGSLDLQRGDALVFGTASQPNAIAIPYAAMVSVSYRRQLTRHLGVIAGITVSLVRKRERRHFFDIAYTDEKGVKQTATFEVSKTEPQVVAAVLKARAPKACGTTCGANDPGVFG